MGKAFQCGIWTGTGHHVNDLISRKSISVSVVDVADQGRTPKLVLYF